MAGWAGEGEKRSERCLRLFSRQGRDDQHQHCHRRDGLSLLPSMAALASDGTVWVVWRKIFSGNVRDIVVASSMEKGATFSQSMRVSKDGWAFEGCPPRSPSVAFDRQGRLYVGWYTEGTDEQPRIYLAVSDDRGRTFPEPVSLHASMTSLPDHLRMAVHGDGTVIAVWEEVTGVQKWVVMRASDDRGCSFGPVVTLSEGAKAEQQPAVAVSG